MKRTSCISFSILVFLLSTISLFLGFFKNGLSEPYITSSKANTRNLVLEGKEDIVISDSYDNLFWFVHVSDLHISKFLEFRKNNIGFRRFSKVVPSVIDPLFIIATGDLTDAKSKSRKLSSQFEEEWKEYKNILEESKLSEPGYFYDIRGNHDCFNVREVKGEMDLFSNFSNIKETSYSFQKITNFGKYGFISIDACPKPGASRPFNFFGHLNTKEMDDLSKSLHEFNKDGVNHTFVFGHYPLVTFTSDLSSKGESLSDLSKKFSVYLCGHLHTLFGKFMKMHARHTEGFLELEVGDLGFSKRFRTIAIDHDLISFIDDNLDSWPLILITNPKDATKLISSHEPVHRIFESSHIRLLIWSPHEIQQVSIYINDKIHPQKVTPVFNPSTNMLGPLYVSIWNPSELSKGVNKITVVALDVQGNEKKVTQFFTVDGSEVEVFTKEGFFLSLNPTLIVKTIYWIIHTFSFASLILPGYWHYLKNKQMKDGYLIWRKQKIEEIENLNGIYLLYKLLIHQFIRFCDLLLHRTYYSLLLLFCLYSPIGPWFIGKFIRGDNGHYGMFFLNGLWIDGEWIKTSDTLLHAIFDEALLYLPILFYISFRCCNEHLRFVHKNWVSFIRFVQLFVFVGLAIQFKSSVDIGVFYTIYAFLLAPCKSWWSFTCLAMLIEIDYYQDKVLISPTESHKD